MIDDFNRANVSPIAGNWLKPTSEASGFKIASNVLVPQSTNTTSAIYYNNPWSNDHYSQVTCRVDTKPGAGIGPTVRQSPTAKTRYQLIISSGKFILARYVNGTLTQIWSRTATFVNGDTIRLEIQGTTLRAFNNNTQIGNDVTDTMITSGNPGITYIPSDSMASVDNWEGGDLIMINYNRFPGIPNVLQAQ